jgi:hypothetical protein
MCICLHKFDAASPPVTLHVSSSHLLDTSDGYGDMRNKLWGLIVADRLVETLDGNMFKCFVKVALLFH